VAEVKGELRSRWPRICPPEYDWTCQPGIEPGRLRGQQRLIFAVPHPLVGSAGVAELLVGALLEDCSVVEDHDVVDLVERV